MSEFVRTLSGVNNQYLFLGVDYVVYVEGGKKSYSRGEVYAGNHNEDTEDIIFWSNIFKYMRPEIKYKFKSVGSKSTLKDISRDVIDGRLDRVYLAMDNEFDEVLNQRIKHGSVFYTHGYSYENDVWCDKLIGEVLKEVTATDVNEELISEGFKGFLRDINLAVVYDGYLFSKGSAFFPRSQGVLFCVECGTSNFPNVKKTEIEKIIALKKLKETTVKSFGRRKKINSKKFCYGHLLADFCCQVILYYLKTFHKLNGLKKEIIYRMGIKKFFDNFAKHSELVEYYELQFNDN